MNWSKPIIAGLFFFLILFLLIQQFFYAKLSPYQAIPNTSPVIIAWNDIDIPFTDKDYRLDLPAEEIDLLKGIYEIKSEIAASIPMIQVLQLTGEEGMKSTFILDLSKSHITEKELLEKFSWESQGATIFRGEEIITFERSNGQKHTSCQFKNLWLLGTYSFQVEEALAQLKLKDQSVYSDKSFKKILSNNKLSPSYSIFFQIDYLNTWMKKWFSTSFLAEVNRLTENSSWLRINIGGDKVNNDFNGQILTSYNSLFGKQGEQRLKALSKVLPSNTFCFFQFELNKKATFYKNKVAPIPPWFKMHFQPWIEGSIAFVQTEATGTQFLSNRFLVLEFSDFKVVENSLNKLLEQSGELDGFTYQSYEVKRLVEENLLQPILGEKSWVMKNPYFVVLDNFVVFGKEQSAMELWIDQFIVGETLNKVPSFSEEQFFKEESNEAYFYLNTKWLQEKTLSGNHRPFFLDGVLANENHLLIGKNKKGYFKVRNYRSETKNNQASIIWRTPIGAKLQKGPQSLRIEGRLYFIFQDINNYLYLLGEDGQIRWKQKLSAPVISDFKLIDLKGRGELQLVFNTRDKIYALNFAGDLVENFPIQLESVLSNGLIAIDFDQIKDFSFFVASENGNVYGLDERGIPIAGWNPLIGVNGVSHAILHYQEEEKDYLIILDNNGKLSVFKRDASLRFPPLDVGLGIIAGPFLHKIEGEVKIVLLDKQGKVYLIDLDGSLKVNSFSTNKENVAAYLGAGSNDIYFLAEQKLSNVSIQEAKVEKQWDKNLEGIGYEIFPISNNSYISLLDRGKNQIMLLNNIGQEHPAFPLAGDTKFELVELAKSRDKMIIVGNQNNIIAYRIGPFIEEGSNQ